MTEAPDLGCSILQWKSMQANGFAEFVSKSNKSTQNNIFTQKKIAFLNQRLATV